MAIKYMLSLASHDLSEQNVDFGEEGPKSDFKVKKIEENKVK